MTQDKKILVVGATGAQGGSVARHLLAGGQFAVRALTRQPDSDRAAGLRAAGAEVVFGDLDDPSSLAAALGGCWGCFGVTNFWEHFEREEVQGRNLMEAVAAAGVEHFVFSSLPDVEHLTGGEFRVPHTDTKGRLEAYARARNIPATFVHVAFYYENYLTWFRPQLQGDGRYHFGFPQGHTPLAMVAAEDVGGVVTPIFERREEFLGQTIGIVGDDRPVAAYAADMTRLLGRDVVYDHIPRDVFASFGFPGAEDLASMFDYQRQHVPDRQTDLATSRRLYPGLQSFGTWLERNAAQFLQEEVAERV